MRSFLPTAEQTMLTDSVRQWVGAKASPELTRRWFETGDHTEFETRLTTAGWRAIGIPETAGGHGGGLFDLALLASEFGRGAAPNGGWLATSSVLPAIAEVIGDRVVAGGQVCLVADASRPYSPGGAGVEWTAGGKVSGAVRYVLAADRVQYLVVAVDGSAGLELVLVNAGAPGLTIIPRRLLDHSRTLGDIALTEVAVVPLDIDAEKAVAATLSRFAILLAADTVGACDAMLAMAVEYSKQRKQFGVPIGSFQAVQHAAAEMLAKIEPVRSVVYLAAAGYDAEPESALLPAAVAKAQAALAGVAVAESALTIQGAIGFTWEHDLQLFYKRVKASAGLGGGPETWNEMIATALNLDP